MNKNGIYFIWFLILLSLFASTISYSDDAVSSFWTPERMLMATPMPATQAEREFVQSHPSLNGIRRWSFTQFASYVDSPLGKQYVAGEAMRWRYIAALLQKRKIALQSLLSISEDKTQNSSSLDSASDETIKKMLAGKDAEYVFEQMKIWRQQISDRATEVEVLRKAATQKGLDKQAEQAIDAVKVGN